MQASGSTDLSSKEGSFETSAPALDAALELSITPAAEPEISYYNNTTSVDVVLDAEASSHSIQWDDGTSIVLNHEDLDVTVGELAGTLPGLDVSDDYAETPWDSQLLLKGSHGDDSFMVTDGFETEPSNPILQFEATEGSDRYEGSNDLERVDYGQLENDALSGLYISDQAEHLPLISNNLPPLIADHFANDDLLVYKDYSTTTDESNEQVDLLSDIDILSLSEGNDVLDLASSQPSLIVDFADGHDTAKVSSYGHKPHVDNYLGLEELQWTPLDSNGDPLVTQPISFDVAEWNEDANNLMTIGDYPPDPETESTAPWQLSGFSLPGTPAPPVPDWIELVELPPTPELVGEGRVVVDHVFVEDSDDSNLVWLEISVHDQRPDGLGLVGLEVNLDWNASALSLRSEHLNTDDVFNAEHLPLFQSVGTPSSNEGRDSLRGLGAAALPRAEQGLALGLSEHQGGQSLFARVAFSRESTDEAIDLHLTPTLTPPAGGVRLDSDDLLVLDDRSPTVWVMRALPDQQQVGSHAFTLTRGTEQQTELKHVAITIREVNDAPQPKEASPTALEMSLAQDSVLHQNVSALFTDQDDADLTYALLDAPAWLQLDAISGAITGRPGNAEVGEFRVTVQASDGRGGTANQTLRFDVRNVNDNPVLGSVVLQPPELRQGESFTYRIPPGVFSDPDLLVDPEERLTYSLVPVDPEQAIPAWLQLDTSTGTLSGTAGPNDVGDNRFLVRATDRLGLHVDQAVLLSVSNVNDAPGRTTALEAFLAAQQPTEDGAQPPGEDHPFALFSGLNRTIDLKPWFTDPDLAVDVNEHLNLTVTLDTGTGSPIDLSDETAPAWLQWDRETGVLTLNPEAEQIGRHFLRVRATDVEGLMASALVPLLVRHRNSAPFQQITTSDDFLTASIREGVLSTTPQHRGTQFTGVQFELEEESAIRIELPSSLYSDIDLSIDPAERLTYALTSEQDLPFSFDPHNLSLTGSTNGLGLGAAGGRTNWSAQLVVSDAAGQTASFDLNLVLQRSAAAPQLTTVVEPALAHWDEGSAVALASLLDLNLEQRAGDVVELLLERSDSNPQRLTLQDAQDQDLAAQADGSWLLRGTAQEIKAQLAELSLRVANDDHAIGTFSLRATARSELGSTGLRSEAISTDIGFSLDPVATEPRWSQLISGGADDAFALSRFADVLTADLVDPREQLIYAVQLPESHQDLLITNRSGEAIGTREGNQVLLSPDQWALAMLRTNAGDAEPVDLQVRAFSSEPSTGLQAASSTQSLKWQPTPLLLADPQALLISPNGVQRSTETSSVSVALNWPKVARSGQLQIDLPLGSALTLDGFDVQSSELDGKQRFVVTLAADGEQSLPAELALKVSSPEIFRGLFEGSLELISSVRSELPSGGLSAEELATEQAAGLTRQRAPINFSWEVAQVAQKPEFGADSNLRFNPITGEIQIDLRRGSSSSGYRNPAEALTLSVRNIPAGYTLAKFEGGEYQAVGATDAFGTMTLFTLPAEEREATPETMKAFRGPIDNNKLYLVSLDDDPEPLSSAQSLSLAITARISDQPGGDSRSVAATRQLSLAPFSNGPPPKLSNARLVDPVILDLGGTGLPLTTLEGGVSFAMLPKAEAIPTAWLSPEANRGDQRSAGLLVLNDPGNDPESGDVTISSITELLSEFFQAGSFASGSAALASLNSNGDQQLDANDEAWSKLQLWFDDGDAISETDEFVAIGDVLSSIDLGSLETLSEQPNWAAGNAVLRRLSGVNLDDPPSDLALYDIGLRVAPAGSAPLPLSVSGPLKLQENGNAVSLGLTSSSDEWQEGQDALTLVRLSGLPDELVPSLGVKDSRGDWLFTWADLNANSGDLKILSSPDWSGVANLQLLISQLQDDGTLLSSALTSVALDVEAVADTPVLQVNATTIREDQPVALSSLLGRAELTDTDGSEALSFQLRKLPPGARIEKHKDGVISLIEASETDDAGVEIFNIAPNDLEDLLFVPPADRSGQLSFEWHAVATEQSNTSTASTIANVLINVRAIADAPLTPTRIDTAPPLVEGHTIALTELIQQPLATSGLSDTDGSEQLRLEFSLPSGLMLQKQSNPNWTPLSAQIHSDGRCVVVINAEDFAALQLADVGIRQSDHAPSSLPLAVTRISRENSTGDQARSSTLEFDLIVDRQARPASITLLEAPSALEDDGGIALTDLLQAEASQAGDQLTYKISGLAEGFTLVDVDGAVQRLPNGTPLTLASLEGWHLRAAEHESGEFSVDIQVVSTPPGQGASAQTAIQPIQFSIAGVADTPKLNLIAAPDAPLTIERDGWLNLGDLGFNLNSADQDGSERLSVVITALDESGQPQPLPSQAKFINNGVEAAQLLDDGSWMVKQTELNGLKLYLKTIADELSLQITPRSEEGNSVVLGEPTQLIVAANAEVQKPMLSITETLRGAEDQPIPLLLDSKGVIDAFLQGNGAGQSLELELTDLPKDSLLLEAQGDSSEPGAQNFIPVLRHNDDGELTHSLRLPYHQWSNIYWQAPPNGNGSFNFKVEAFSVGNNGKTLSSGIESVQVLINPVNDAPGLNPFQNLASIEEGTAGIWNLRSRFNDVDNTPEQLVVTARQITMDGKTTALPEWLSLDADGVLSGTPSNSDVGVLNLEITAIDPLGQLTSERVSLAVGDLNVKPTFDAKAMQEWTTVEDETNTYWRTLNLREAIHIDLSTAFHDEDLINNDQLSYTVSRDGRTWSDAIPGLAEISEGILTIQPEGKNNVGTQSLQLRAEDLQGLCSDAQNLRLTVRNINDPPVVTRDGASLLRAGVWQETVQLEQGDPNWELNLEGLFDDADAGDRIDQIAPTNLPSWLTYRASSTSTGGVLSGTPGNGDVGVETIQWQALDDAGSTATYRLRLEVKNINDAPELRDNPDLSELGRVINGAPTVDQDAYGRLDLAELFVDPDNLYGDTLQYSIKEVRKYGETLESAPDWLGLTYRSSTAPNAAGKLLVEPVLYRINSNGSTGERLAPGEISQLNANTPVRVVVEATDDRNVKRKGLIGVDLDVSWNSSINLVADSTEISADLPMFNSIETKGNSLRVIAGAAPDIGSGDGSPVGDQRGEAVVSFDVIINDPTQRVVIGLSQGEGLDRDGLLGRDAEEFNDNNSVIHSFASKIYLETLQPDNDAVGRYEIDLNAVDRAGEEITKTLELVIANLNDAPLVDQQGAVESQLLVQWLSQQGLEGERNEHAFRIFADPDLRFEDSLTYQLVPGSNATETEHWAIPNSIQMKQATDGSVVLDLRPPRGLTSAIEQQFKLVARDQEGLSTASDWFTVVFKPLAEATLLTSGDHATPLEASQIGAATQKNASLDLQSVLNLNAMTLADPAGDEVVLKLLVKQSNAVLSLADSAETSFLKHETVKEGMLFTIDMQKLAQATGEPAGSLEGLKLSVPANQFELLPRALSPNLKAGIPLQIWSETRVLGDEDEQFNVAITERSTVWVPIENTRPVYTQPSITKLDHSFFSAEQFNPGQTLVHLQDLFIDVDPSETLEWEIEVPRALRGLVELDRSAGEVKLARHINEINDLPVGSHRLIVRAKDTSASIGDASGVATGSLRFFISNAKESPSVVRGLNLLTQMAEDDVNSLYTKNASERTDNEQQVITILETLNIEESNRSQFLQKLEQGSLAVLANSNPEKPMVLIDASRNSGAILMDAAVDDTDAEVVMASKKLLDDRDIVDTPLGEIEFTVDTQGRDFSVVQLQMEDGGVNMDTLFKTDSEGNPLVFQSEVLSYSAEDGPLEEWLKTLNYGIYNYGAEKNQDQSPLISINSSDSSLVSSLLSSEPLFDLNEVEMIDGSAFLIDLDQNNTIDLVSMLLVDQGWFDTRKDIVGLIGDPLIPATTEVKAISSLPDKTTQSLESLKTRVASQQESIALETSRNQNAARSPARRTTQKPEISESDISNSSDQNTANSGDANPSGGVLATESDTADIQKDEYENDEQQIQQVNPSEPNTTDKSERDSAGLNQNKIPEQIHAVNTNQSSPYQGAAHTVQDGTNDTQLYGGGGAPDLAKSNTQPRDTNSNFEQSNTANASNDDKQTRSFLSDLQSWLDQRRQDASNALRSIIAPLEQPNETSVTAVIGMILLPLLTERSLSQTVKSIDQEFSLKILRRDRNFNGQWLGQSHKGNAVIIKRVQGILTIEKVNKSLPKNITKLPGFNNKSSLLSIATTLAPKPGKLIRELLNAKTQLLQSSNPEINWISWLEYNFDMDDRPRASHQEAINSLEELKQLVEKACSYEPALADVLMLNQILDCLTMLGMDDQFQQHTLKAKRKSIVNPISRQSA